MTTDDLFPAIDHFLAIQPYYPCLLLVHPEMARLYAATRQILSQYAWPGLSIGSLLSQALLPVAPKQRPRQAKRTFADTVQAHVPGPVLCTDIDLLFEPSLYLDPLRLLREASRQARLVVIWPGTFANGVLAYATPSHAHYQTWTQTDLCDDCILAL